MATKELVSMRRNERDDDKKGQGRPQLIDYLRPWIGVPLLIPAGYVTYWLWGDAGWTTGLAAAAITAAGGVVGYVTHKLTDARTWYAHHIATAMTSGAAAWLALATVFSPGRPMMDLLLLGGATLAAISNVHTWAACQQSTETRQEKPGFQLVPWERVKEILRIKGVSMRVTKQTEAITKGELLFEDGATVEELQRRRKELASIYKVAPGAVRITEHPDRADKGEITIITKNVMKDLIPWPGLDPKMTGASIADGPLTLGLYEDGEVFTDEVDDRHTVTVGMSGSGKSVYGKAKLTQIAARRDTFVTAIDMSKGRQTLGPVGKAIGWGAFDKKSAKAQLNAIKRAITARADYLGSKGLPGWTKDCGLVFLHVLIEEAADLIGYDELVEIGRAARSAGIHLEVSLQRATFSNLDTDARANFGDAICFGVKNEADASFALPEYVMDAGVEPHRWAASQPGSAYAAVRAADVERHPTPVKMFGPPTTRKEDENNDLTPAAESLPDQDSKLDPVTRKAFGTAYADYLAGAGSTGQVEDGEEVVVDGQEENVDETDETGAEEDQGHEEVEPVVLSTPDEDPDVVGDLEAEIPPLEEDFALPTRAPRKGTKASAEEARAAVESLIEEWGAGTVFDAFQLKSELAEMGVERKKTWVYDRLRHLEGEGRITQDDEGAWIVQQPRELAPA